MITKMKALALAITLSSLSVLPACAQSMKVPKTQKANWYKSSPELQILDERPIVHDFREAPSAPSSIQLPPPPQGFGGGSGGGAGALGGGDPDGPGGSGPFQIPGGGGQPGYRDFNPGTSLPLAKADFGHAQTNIPAGGMAPKGLQNGTSTGLHGLVKPFNPMQPNMAMPMGGPRANNRPAPAAPQAASYNPGGGYGRSSGSGAVGASGANSSVTGRLLKKQQ